MTAPGKLYGVGLGTGDPKLMTLRAVEVIGLADVVAYHSAKHGRSNARRIAAAYIREDHVEEHLVYPLTTETTDHPGGYRGAIEEFYESAAERLAAHLDAGRSVAILSEGDPLIYSSYQHMHKRLAHRYVTETVPGVSSIQASVAALGVPLTEDREVLTVLPGTLPEEELAARIASTDSAVILKMGRTFPAIRAALETAGRLDDAWYVERATMPEQRVERLADVDPATVPYFSMAVLPSKVAGMTPRRDGAGAADELQTNEGADAAQAPSRRGKVTVIGTGPAGPLWLTPEVKGALAVADDLVGYTTYIKRVPERAGQVRHLSDNKVESERAEFALSLAREGRNVVVVSSGDPGVFAMATAVLEVACEEQYSGIEVRVMPGMTAAHAAAARVGAPLGHDYATISLSDRLKPWSVISRRIRLAAEADLVLAIYNPASKERRQQVVDLKALLLEVRKPETPVVLARDIGGPTEVVRIQTLGDLDTDVIDMRTLILVGSSQTQLVERATGETVVWTPRRYPD
ncbi:precorrin-3B C(17)-methyltransferase [Nocardioides jejuensis]|uniref:Precorrin-3B C(17)-methyltransferase n=1 Tax=Nocardioides jejuensis TaxID=2502782 RepID=A0A4R1CH70_9ACTN|nr:precorrin-3B C(17)-methyltransferase [Nocardioides jejuensis]TCJ29436.1 precorrin-3B C(17)-methyltransferase [Nocardioides jejuensis]